MTLAFLSPTPAASAAPPPRARSSPGSPRPAPGLPSATGGASPPRSARVTAELEALRAGAGIADRSAIGKLELQGPPAALGGLLASIVPGGPPDPGETDQSSTARDVSGTPRPTGRSPICEPAEIVGLRELLENACGAFPHCGLVELTAGLAAIEVRGPSRARICSSD